MQKMYMFTMRLFFILGMTSSFLARSAAESAAVVNVNAYQKLLGERLLRTLGDYLSPANRLLKVKQLIEQGAPVNVRNDNGSTPLKYAAAEGYTDIVRILLEAGADSAAQDNWGETALIAASRAGKMQVVGILLTFNDAALDLKNNDGDTALIMASRGEFGSHHAIMKMLIREGANPFIRNNQEETVFRIAKLNRLAERALGEAMAERERDRAFKHEVVKEYLPIPLVGIILDYQYQ